MTAKRSNPIKIAVGPPFETSELRRSLTSYLAQLVADSHSGSERRLGNFKFGVYAFYDYDGEPIYVGQTNEKLSKRIRRHLTNQRTDAVAMKVLDPFEVREIEVWPLPHHQQKDKSDSEAKAELDWLESAVFQMLLKRSRFKANGAYLGKFPFGLSLSKPLRALRQAQGERDISRVKALSKCHSDEGPLVAI